MTSEIVLPAGTEYIAIADVPELIAQALHPDRASEELTVSYFIKSASPGATGEAAKWDGCPIEDDDRQVLHRLWSNMTALPDHATADEVQPYLEKANTAGLDWTLGVCWTNAQLNSDIVRIDAEHEHRKAIVAAIRGGRLKVVAPHTRLPADERQGNADVSVEELTRYVAQFKLEVRVPSTPQSPKAPPFSASSPSLGMTMFPQALPKVSLWDLACLITGQNAIDEKPTNDTRHQLAELAQAVYGQKLWVEFSPGAGFDFVSGFMPSAVAARVDTDWRSLDRITVRREDWQRYLDELRRQEAQTIESIRQQVSLWELRQPANLFSGEGFSEEMLKLTTLSKYLEFETWTPETAALLVSGIQAPIPCDAIPLKGAMGLDNRFIMGNLDPFHQARWILELWRSRENAPARVRPLDFIAWCKSKSINTSWLRAVEGKPETPTEERQNPSPYRFTDEDRQRFLEAESWDERVLQALCLGVPRYADLDEIAPQPERDDVRLQISAAIKRGELPSERNPDAGPGNAIYGGLYRIDPIRAVRWAIGKFPRLPEWISAGKLRDMAALQQAEKDAAGRYTLGEAAKMIAGTGERFEVLQGRLCVAAELGELSVHGPGELVRYQYLNGAKARSYYEEAYWDDLNTWLAAFEPRVAYRFVRPEQMTSPVARSEVAAADCGESKPKKRPLARQRYQEDEILRVIGELGHDPKALPKRVPGQAWVKSVVKDQLPDFTPKVFNLAWERLRDRGDVAES